MRSPTERAGSARRINAFRAIAVTLFLVILLGFRSRRPGWVGPSLWLFAGYCGAAIAVWAATRTRPHVPWIASLSAGYAADASQFAFHAPLYYVLLLTSMLAITMVAFLCGYASRRAVRLVGRVASEQLRRERLGRYFSPQIVERLDLHGDVAAAGERHEVTILSATYATSPRSARRSNISATD